VQHGLPPVVPPRSPPASQSQGAAATAAGTQTRNARQLGMGVQLTGLSPASGGKTAAEPESPTGWESRLRRALTKVVAWDQARAKVAASWVGPESHPMLQELEQLRARLLYVARDVRRVTVWPVQGRKMSSDEAKVRQNLIRQAGLTVSDCEAGPLSIPVLQGIEREKAKAAAWKEHMLQAAREHASGEPPPEAVSEVKFADAM